MARVLLVDDSFIVRELLSAVLADSGHAVQTAEDGESALALVAAGRPDVVVCDLQMPGLSGLDVVKALKQREPLLPTLILTEQSDVAVCVRALREGAVGYVLKGMSDELLLSEIEAALGSATLLAKNRELEEANNSYRKHLEEMVAQKTAEVLKLQSAKNQAERMAALGTLVAGVAHEVNNPLAVVKSSLGWLADFGETLKKAPVTESADKEATEDLREDILALPSVISEASQGVERIMKIVKALRRISNPSSPGGTCRLTDALNDAELQARPTAQAGVILEHDLEDPTFQVAFSREDLCTVLTHLLTNATQALPPLGGTIRVSARRTPIGNIEVSISDTGMGIKPDLVDRVCEPFFTTKDPGKGIGLGLTLVRQVVTGQGGGLRIQSHVGEGTSVVLELPPPSTLTPTLKVSQGRLRV
jgi:signal transduction histidine kinase